jgi:amidophosphoribosyltransferase
MNVDHMDKLQEECGIFGMSCPPDEDRDPAMATYHALFALQHRGQESCGITVNRDGELAQHKSPGLVPDVFTPEILESLSGAQMAIGHVRYASDTSGRTAANAQPIIVHHASGSMALCYNGKLVNSKALRQSCENRGGIFRTTNDAEVISYMIVREHLRTNTLEDAVVNAMPYMIGAFSLIVMDRTRLIAARDPNGFRPLCMGKVGGSIVFASESCAIQALGGEFIRDVRPGEVIVAEKGTIQSLDCGIRAKSALCLFELIYFARQDSVVDGMPVGRFRESAGRMLARRNTVQGDVVIGVPDSGLAAAMGFSKESGIPYGIGLMKNRYIQRTFIQSQQWERDKSVRIKLNALSATVKGKRVILIDDSIVRGTTCKRIVGLLRHAGAAEVHMKVTAPPFLNPCYFGTHIPSSDQLAAYERTTEEVREMIGADSLQYMELDDLKDMIQDLQVGVCDACFTGHYVLPVPRV